MKRSTGRFLSVAVAGALASVALTFALRPPGCAQAAALASAAPASASAVVAPLARSHGLWVWSTNDLLADPSPLLDACQRTGTTEVYLAVTHPLLNDARLPKMVAKLASSSIRVEALMGDPTWYRREKSPAMLGLIDDVLAFNARNSAGFAAIHLDVEPHTLPENKGVDVMSYLPDYTAAMQRARDEAARGNLGIGADIPRKVLGAPVTSRHALVQTVPRLFLMLYELRHHAEAVDVASNELAHTSQDNLAAAYDTTGLMADAGSAPGQMVIGISVADYPDRLPLMRGVVEQANSANPRYGGWAVHDYTELKATLK